MRIRDHAGPIPKPMVRVGYRPILWHVMKYYAHYGHREFILCLGHGADHIKDYFVRYDETVSNDFVLDGSNGVELLTSDLHDWRITFVDTGREANVGERLLAVRPFLGDDEVFLANYADGVTDAPLDRVIEAFHERGKAAQFLGVRPNYTTHAVAYDADGTVHAIEPIAEAGVRINGGFMVLHRRVFDFIRPGEDLVAEPFRRLIEAGELATYAYDGFWACMDTFKEKKLLEDIHNRGEAPWAVWDRKPAFRGDGAPVPLPSLG